MKKRTEHDSMGEIQVEEDKFWGAQTQRSLENFQIGNEKMPLEVIYALTHIKMACATINETYGYINIEQKDAILHSCDDILTGKLDDQFPLSVWQTGSGTQSNMNVNEVIAKHANVLANKALLHPNDDVNRCQSSNDVFPSAMHIAAIIAIQKELLPAIEEMCTTLKHLEKKNQHYIKIGRTHLQDATPITFSQEISGWRGMLENNIDMLQKAIDSLRKLAIGGTAVGTCLNAPTNYGEQVCLLLSEQLATQLISNPNKFHALSAKDDLCFAHGALKSLAVNMMKFANDVRWLASGPRCGLGEIRLPENEPGSSIMPGKVNPTQCEAICMIASQVMGNDVTIGLSASQGNFELNVYMPVIIYNFLQSIHLLSEGLTSFRTHCVEGIIANEEQMLSNVERSTMLITALTPSIGYEKASIVANKALQENITLKQACLQLEYCTSEEFDTYVIPEKMV